MDSTGIIFLLPEFISCILYDMMMAACGVRKDCKTNKCGKDRLFRADHYEDSQGMYTNNNNALLIC